MRSYIFVFPCGTGVVTKPSPEYCLQDQLKLYSDEPKTVVVLVAGIRPIKDPLHLLYAFHGKSISWTYMCKFKYGQVLLGKGIDYGRLKYNPVFLF